MERQALAYRIRAFRKLKGYTQAQFADRLGVSVGIIGAIERGTRRVDARMLSKIADGLNVDQQELTAVVSSREGD